MDDDLAPWLADARLPRVLGLAEALERGMSRQAIDRRLATGAWRRLLPRTFLTADTCSERDRVNAALVFAGRGAALSGAGALWAARVRRIALPAETLVLVPADNFVSSRAGVRIRRSTRPLTYDLGPGPRRVELGRAAVDLAVTLRSLTEVRALIARVVQDGHCTLDELAQALESGPRRGSRFARQALAEVGRGAASAPEAQAATILVDAGITGWTQNARLVLPDGSVRVVDFYWPHLRACLEIDSVEWHFDVRAWSGTWDRHLDLSKFGYSVVHRPPSAMRDPGAFVRDIRAWLAGREADLRRGIG